MTEQKKSYSFQNQIVKIAKEDEKKFPATLVSFEYKIKDTIKISNDLTRTEIPFPPYRTSPNYQIFIFLSSIFAPLISDKSYSEIINAPLIKWLYFYKINYPHMPNIYDLMLELDLSPEKVLFEQNPSMFRYIIHQFCKAFSNQFSTPTSSFTVKDFSMAIPSNEGIFKKENDEMIVFVPVITPIAPYSSGRGKLSSGNTNDPNNLNDNKESVFPFQTVLNFKYTMDGPSTNEEVNLAFTSINPNSNSNDNSNTNDLPTKDIKYVFYGGIFESSEEPIKFVLININDKYYKYSCCVDNQDFQNYVEVIPDIKKVQTLSQDFCVAAFYLKEHKDTPIPRLYQQLESK